MDERSEQIAAKVLRTLREVYPAKVDEIVLVAAVQKDVSGASVEMISRSLDDAVDRGYIESTMGEGITGEGRWFKISARGIERLQELEMRTMPADVQTIMELERRMVGTYERVHEDLERMRGEVEGKVTTLSREMGDMEGKIGDHDQVIRTYFVRVIETFGVFVGIFAVVVVSVLNRYEEAAKIIEVSPVSAVILVLGTPLAVLVVVLIMLYGIKRFVLMPGVRR
ncbi:MAG: hypothetical protein A4E30_01160 [Methanomassiliicoccales archaeon PtaB.Bin215]|nr:MAG: hypothetical protein A4E30_01160 [Methanomassiliicoccales archaeon PtaB.Bin215]